MVDWNRGMIEMSDQPRNYLAIRWSKTCSELQAFTESEGLKHMIWYPTFYVQSYINQQWKIWQQLKLKENFHPWWQLYHGTNFF